MPDGEQSNKNDFIVEKIKERPINRKKLIRRTLITAGMAVIFGLIACFTFLILEPVINNWLYPEEEPQIVVFPEDQEEMSPEEMLSDNMQMENQNQSAGQGMENQENMTLVDEQIQEILSGVILDKDDFKQIYTSMSEYAESLSRYMVTITGVTSNIDWFNNVQESRNQTSGVIIANNTRELLILADYAPLRQAESLSVTFYNSIQASAQVKERDGVTGLCVLSVNLSELPQEMVTEEIQIAALGSSTIRNIVGTPIIALGSPMGVSGSQGYGMITAVISQLEVADTNYKLLQTDIVGSENAGGVLFNLQGQVIGIITNNDSGSDMKAMITAYGISELKKRVELMSNGNKAPYLGIIGIDVTREAHEEIGVPYGAYIKEVEMDSPSMLAGIQQGDILTSINNRTITNYNDYATILMQLETGDTAELTIMRQAQNEYREMKFSIVLGEAQ